MKKTFIVLISVGAIVAVTTIIAVAVSLVLIAQANAVPGAPKTVAVPFVIYEPVPGSGAPGIPGIPGMVNPCVTGAGTWVTIYTSQRYTVPAGVREIYTTLLGGGAGGGLSYNSSTGGGGGGSGRYLLCQAVPMASYLDIVVGNGGNAGLAGDESNITSGNTVLRAPGGGAGGNGGVFSGSANGGGAGGYGGGDTVGRVGESCRENYSNETLGGYSWIMVGGVRRMAGFGGNGSKVGIALATNGSDGVDGSGAGGGGGGSTARFAGEYYAGNGGYGVTGSSSTRGGRGIGYGGGGAGGLFGVGADGGQSAAANTGAGGGGATGAETAGKGGSGACLLLLIS